MPDPLTIIGATASVFQLVANASKAVRTLRDAIASIKHAPEAIHQIQDRLEGLDVSLGLIDQALKRSSGIPDKAELHKAIRHLMTSCLRSLRTLQESLPSRLQSNMAQAFNLWIHDHVIRQTLKHIDEYIQHLTLLLQTLNLFTVDHVDGLLREIADFLRNADRTRQSFVLDESTNLTDGDRQVLEAIRQVELFAKNTATMVSVQTVRQAASEGATTTTANSIRTMTGRADKYEVEHLEHRESPRIEELSSKFRLVAGEWEQNRVVLSRLRELHFYKEAVTMQRRALEIKKELEAGCGISFSREERNSMQQELADILIDQGTEESTAEALSILEELLSLHHHALECSCSARPPPPLPDGGQGLRGGPDSAGLRLHQKIGRLYSDANRLEEARNHLKVVFNAYADERPRSMQKIEEVGYQLLNIYTRLADGGTEPSTRVVLRTQQDAFRNTFEETIGHPLRQQKSVEEALQWCLDEGIPVPEHLHQQQHPGQQQQQQDYRFNVLVEDVSSPLYGSSILHRAAQSCRSEGALTQILDHSVSLETPDIHGDTPLHVAVVEANTTAISILLQRGASARARNRQRQTPLHRSTKLAVTRLLLQHRLRRESASSTISSPWMTSYGIGGSGLRRDSSSSSTLTVATRSPPSFLSFRDEEPLEIDAQDSHNKTALFIACSMAEEKIVAALLLAGADARITQYGHSPLAEVIQSTAPAYTNKPNRRVNIIAALVSRGADVEDGKEVLRNTDINPPLKKRIARALDGEERSLLLVKSSLQSFELGGPSRQMRAPPRPVGDLLPLELDLDHEPLPDFQRVI